MSQSSQTTGACVFCGRKLTRSGMGRHLKACPERKAAIAAADQGSGVAQPVYHLQVQDAWGAGYWLHLEMSGNARLDELDHYLRAIWLECCGHLSEFRVGGWGSQTMGMTRRAASVFLPGQELMHIYDFGTSSETGIRTLDVRRAKPLTSHPIFLMARNDPPKLMCSECEQPAEWLCLECVNEHGKSGALCAEHARTHPHEDYGSPVPMVNSPRTGMCGYDGPATPPY
jgi:hypothetical protein